MGQANQGFPRQVRILKTDEFSSVFSFRKRILGHYLAIHYQPNSHVSSRLGVVVAKKITRLSVHRNYMKRVIRELFRKQREQFDTEFLLDLPNKHVLPKLDLIIRTQKTFTSAEFLVVEAEFKDLFAKLQKNREKLIQAKV